MNKGIGIKIDPKDLKKLTKKIDAFSRFERIVDIRLRNNAQDTANESARRTPVNDANLRNSIRASKISKLFYDVIVGARYGAFIEWGTRHKFSRSNLKDMIELGIPESYAEQFKAVPLKKATNLKARPFLFPTVRKNWVKTLKLLRKDIDRIIRKR